MECRHRLVTLPRVPQSKIPPAELKLTPDDVRLITLQAQGLIGSQARAAACPRCCARLGAVQLDTISVLARSHELVAYARLGAIAARQDRASVLASARSQRFRVLGSCGLRAADRGVALLRVPPPLASWPRGKRWHDNHPGVAAEVLASLRSEGPLTATELGGAKNGGAWWDWSETKIAVEWLLDTGEVICARRTGWRRVYDLPERVLPSELLGTRYTDAECLIHLTGVTARALGVVTKADLSDYQRVTNFGSGRNSAGLSADDAASAAELIPVEIDQGSRAPVRAWADPDAVASFTAADGKRQRAGRHRVTLLSPFDSLIWDRKRTLRAFAFEHSLEAYVPREKRVHGYFTMPLLAGGRLVGRVDPGREGRTLVARQLTLDTPRAAEPMARALAEAASWVGCDSVALGRVSPATLESRLRSALTAQGAAS